MANFNNSPLAYQLMAQQLRNAGNQKVTGPLQALATTLSGIPQGLASRETSNREQIAQQGLASALGGGAEAEQLSNIYRANPALGNTLLGLRAKGNQSANLNMGPAGNIAQYLISDKGQMLKKTNPASWNKFNDIVIAAGKSPQTIYNQKFSGASGTGQGTLLTAKDIAQEKAIGSQLFTKNADGSLSPIQGSATQVKREADAKKTEFKNKNLIAQGDLFSKKISDARNLVKEEGSGFGGVTGAIPKITKMIDFIGFTDASKLERIVSTLESNIVLQSIADLKKTGGTLGAVSEKELELLKNRLATLDQAESPEDFIRLLDEVEASYKRLSGYDDVKQTVGTYGVVDSSVKDTENDGMEMDW